MTSTLTSTSTSTNGQGQYARALMDAKEIIRLQAQAQDTSISFVLKPAKPLVIHGVNGVDRKADDPAQACFLSRPIGQLRYI